MPSWGRAVAIAGAIAAVGISAPGAEAAPVGEPQLVTRGVDTPWELAPAGDGRTFVVERGGDVRVLRGSALDPGAALTAAQVTPEVNKLLGLALAPDFPTSHRAYLYVSRRVDGTLRNGIWRLRDTGTALVSEGIVFDGIASDGNHDGGRMVFGPDGALYVTTGDIHQPARPQDHQDLNGKVLRFSVTADGGLGVPADNPFVAEGGNARYVWSLGHRHPQGLAFDAAGRLWETEHGPTGEQHGAMYPGGNDQQGRDELNLIVRGGNYGWPLVSGDLTGPGLIPPVAHAPDSPAWAPGDLAVGRDGELYAPFLAGAELREFDVDGPTLTGQSTHVTGLGRLRLAVADGDGLLLAQDGPDAGIYRQALTAPPVPPPTTTPTTATLPATPTAPVAPTVPATPPAPPAVLSRLARRLQERLVRLATRRQGLGRTGVVGIRASGVPAGRLVLELRVSTERGPLLGRTTTTVRSTAARAFAVRIGTRGRARLRAAGGRRIVAVVRRGPTLTAVTSRSPTVL